MTQSPATQIYRTHTLSQLYAKRAELSTLVLARKICMVGQLPEFRIRTGKDFWRAMEARLDNHYFAAIAVYTSFGREVIGAMLAGSKQFESKTKLPAVCIESIYYNNQFTDGQYVRICNQALLPLFLNETLRDYLDIHQPKSSLKIWCKGYGATTPTCLHLTSQGYVRSNPRP